MLTLPIKKKWFDMILSGEKKEEYREMKPYYQSRLCSCSGFYKTDAVYAQSIKFVNGYGNDKPYFIAYCTGKVGKGKVKWGAEKDKQYYVLTIEEITEKGNIKW